MEESHSDVCSEPEQKRVSVRSWPSGTLGVIKLRRTTSSTDRTLNPYDRSFSGIFACFAVTVTEIMGSRFMSERRVCIDQEQAKNASTSDDSCSRE
jgi:hypothetical protein